jgi:hypothetical protein
MVSSSSVNDTGAVTTRNLTLQRPIHSRSIGDRNRKGAKRGDEAAPVRLRSDCSFDEQSEIPTKLPVAAGSLGSISVCGR